MTAASVFAATLRVFLDCSSAFCHEDYLREEVELAQYVRDRTDADVHVLITRAETGAGGGEFTLTFIGLGNFQSITRTLKVTTEASDSEDRVRRQLASTFTIGLLGFLTPDTLPAGLEVTAKLPAAGQTLMLAVADDPWNRWTFSLNGFMNVDSEQSTFESEWGGAAGADRITPEWKLTFGAEINESRERFDLEEEEQEEEGVSEVSVVRKEERANWLVVKSLTDHWSVGAFGHFRSSTFDNLKFEVEAAPAIEWNFFPYSMYTRRQLRVLYGLGVASRQVQRDHDLRHARRDAAATGALGHIRAARTVGHARRPRRSIELLSRPLDSPYRAGWRSLNSRHARLVGECRNVRLADPRSDRAAAPGRVARGSPTARSPVGQ